MTYTPIDHLPKSVRDDSRAKTQESVEHLKALYAHAKRISRGLLTLTDRQSHGKLTRAEGAVLSRMVLANLRASARGQLHYHPGRAVLARDTGYSERTVSKALTRLKDLGLIEVARYAKGGRVHNHGLVTEWRSGGLDGLLEVLRNLGYRLGKSIADTVSEAVNWIRTKLSKRQENKDQGANPTGNLLPGTLVCNPKGTPEPSNGAPAASVGCAESEPEPHGPSLDQRIRWLARRAAAAVRARHGLQEPEMVPMPQSGKLGGVAGRGLAFSLPKNPGRGVDG
ncbi:MAG: hypothetical protein AAF755_00105 [Pseudomonadota bacterium]